jgi:hypothetical protein
MEDGFTFARYWEKHRVSDLVAEGEKSITHSACLREAGIAQRT